MKTPIDANADHGLIAYMARNHVAANLLMLTFLVGGVIMAFFIQQETYPAYELDVIEFSMRYPGAAPEEVEEGILQSVEEEIRGLEAIKRIEAEANEGRGRVQIELKEGVDANRALQDVKVAIDRISSFPEDAEKPTISLDQNSRSTVALAIYGDLDEGALYQFGERVRNDLLSFPEISQVEIWGGRRPEISIEIPESTLRSLNLNLGDIARTIRENAIDVPAGGVRSKAGEILLRTSERKDFASEFADIPLISEADGTKVFLRDVATIKEGFEDADRINFFNGQPGLLVGVHRVGDERPLEIASRVYQYMEELEATLPDKAGCFIFWNSADDYEDRIKLLAKNGFVGLALVLLVLGFFLAPRLAFWVSMGIPVSIVGSLLLLPFLDASINMISLFAFIVTLGMVVDDAVIVGENVYFRMEQGDEPLTAAIRGTREMVVPIFFAVATNIIAFIPMLFVPGRTGKFFANLPVVVIAVFTISLIECLFVLPAHLSRARLAAKNQDKNSLLARIGKLEAKTSHAFDLFTQKAFVPLLRISLKLRYLTASVFIAALLLAWGYYQSGRINFSFDPLIESTRVDAEVYVPYGAPFEEIKRVADHIENAGLRAAERLGGQDKVLQGRMNIIGRRASNAADVNLTIVPEEERDFTAADFVKIWREEVGEVAGLDSLYFEYEVGPSGSAAITVELAHPEREILEHAATELADLLGTYTGVTDINDGFAEGKPQIDFTITPEGRSLGITANHLGRQVRYSYYGAEALRQQRGRNEIKVMVRLPETERRSMHRLEELIIQTPEGGEIPLAQAADIEYNAAPTEIKRVDGKRVLTITANVIPELVNANKVREDLEAGPLPQLVANFPGLAFSFEGRQREQREALASLRLGLMISLIFIFALIAALFRSYLQGFIVMSCIPFAIASALVGHLLMGYDLSIVSVFGMIALTGVAVNGALVLTVTLNDMWRSGTPFTEAVLQAGARRFRPIVLTSLTTFFGLAPMILETSTQARFLVPMAISLGFGVLFSCVVVLLLTMAFHVIAHDFRMLGANLREGRFSFKEQQESELGDLEPLPK